MKPTWTARNTVVTVLACVCVVGAAVLGGLDGAHVISGTWITPTEAALGGLLVGLITPGSPIGRILDMIFPPTSGASAPVPVDVAKAVADLQSIAKSVPYAHPDLMAAITAVVQSVPPPPPGGSS